MWEGWLRTWSWTCWGVQRVADAVGTVQRQAFPHHKKTYRWPLIGGYRCLDVRQT